MPLSLSESQTRALLINALLQKAEWKLSDRTQVGFEIPVAGYDPTPWNGITDFCLYESHVHEAGAITHQVFLAKRRLSEGDLYEPPLTNFGRNAVERFFTPAEIQQIIGLTDHLAT